MDGLHHFEAALHHICTFTYLAEGFFFFLTKVLCYNLYIATVNSYSTDTNQDARHDITGMLCHTTDQE